MSGSVGRAVALLFPFLGALLASSTSPHAGQTTAEAPLRLDVGSSFERALSGGQQHRYELVLQAGEYVRLSLMQRGIDVEAEVKAPDGAMLSHVNDELRDGWEERVEVVAEASGTHLLFVNAAYARGSPGHYALRIVESRRASDGDRSLQEVRKLHAEYAPMLARYQSRAAQPLIERALALTEQARGPDDVQTAKIRRDLGRAFQRQREYSTALPLLERATTVFENALGTEHPATIDIWTSLSATYGALGQRPKAETIAQRALDVGEKVLSPEHPLVALCLITLANRRLEAEDQQAAEELLRRGLKIAEKTLGEMDIQTAVLLNNLATLLIDKGRLEEAAGLLGRSLAIDEALRPDDAANNAITLQNLGMIARQRKEYAKAEDYYLRALALRRQTLGPEHPDIAFNLNNLANVYRAKGDIAKSLDTHFQALTILERTAGPYSGGTILSLGNIARTYAEIGDLVHAVEFQRRVDAAIETQFALNLAIGSERQKLVFASSMADRTERTISLDVDNQFQRPDATELSALVVLQRKGRVLDAMTDAFASVRQRLESAADRQLLDQLTAATGDLARLVLSDSNRASSADRMAVIKRLEGQKERLEAELSARSAEFHAQATPVTLDAVRALIPDDAALIEFAVYRPFNPRAENNSTAYGKPRYVAYAFLPHQPPRGVDLGPAAIVDDAVEKLRQALGDPQRADVTTLSRRLDAVVMQPIRVLVGNRKRLLISPDGALNLVPFEALRDDEDRYAIERYAISYLSSGRDLLRMQVPNTSHSAPVVVANPVFGEPAADVTSGSRPHGQAPRRSVTSVDDLSGAYFAPLASTAQEAEQIKALFPEATVLARERATKSAIAALEAPRMLHIATHGFFLRDAAHKIPNPLLRAGLALSGANTASRAIGNHSKDEGILTALEASNLNLWGTKLVTLSACDTGVGEVRNGEGVYGLRRAFFLAGAETLVMSLWPVRDSVTREMMTAYYRGLQQGLGRGDALRQAQLTMLARKPRHHPFYWASFIQAGEWASLDGAR